MRDLISRQDAIDIFDDYNVSVENGDLEAYSRDRKRLCELPSAQPEPSQVARDIATIIENEQDMRVIERNNIVRCKDCIWKQGAECVRFAEVRPFPDDFCSRAERRTDEQV